MEVPPPRKDHEEVTSRSRRETVMGLETGIGEALRTDYFQLSEEFTPAQLAYLHRARAFVHDEVLPVINGYWERAEFPLSLVRKLGAAGLVGDGIEGYGCPAMDPLSAGLVTMELNRGDGSIGTFLGVQAGLAMRSIALLGSEEQKRRWLPAMARVDTLGAFALTEPDHGSDSVALETTARRDGEEYVIDGSKKWIGNGTVADVIVVWARDTADGQVKGFLVEKGTPGCHPRLIEGKGSLRAVWQASIDLDRVRVPASGRLPGANSFRDTASVLASTRATCAWAALGHAVAGYDAALAYAGRRTQFGRPLAGFQLVQDRLVKMLAKVTAMQLYCRRLADLAIAGRVEPTLAGLAKSHNTTAAREVLAEARDLLGGNGILLDFHVIRHMADIEAIHTFEGTATIQNLIVGRDITGLSAFGARGA
jgi:glutaryl-CoA dehydrogenase